jgi:uncharacterized protein YdhG (YjbR/CyaY superfamily)
MPKTPVPTGKPAARPTTVSEYLAAQPAAARPVLERVRALLKKAIPGAEEVISYQIPAYQLSGITVLHFAGWKQHYSLYPATAGVIATFKKQLAPYEVNDKGTVRFPLDAPVPAALLTAIARHRIKEVKATAAGKKAKKPPSKAAKSPRKKPTPKKPAAKKPAAKRL